MTYEEAKTKAQKTLVKGDDSIDVTRAESAKETTGSTYETQAGKIIEVVEWIGRNYIIKIGKEYDAVAVVWFLGHINRGSFTKI